MLYGCERREGRVLTSLVHELAFSSQSSLKIPVLSVDHSTQVKVKRVKIMMTLLSDLRSIVLYYNGIL